MAAIVASRRRPTASARKKQQPQQQQDLVQEEEAPAPKKQKKIPAPARKRQPTPAKSTGDNDVGFPVSRLLDKRRRANGAVEYKVEWDFDKPVPPSWEPEANISQDLIQQVNQTATNLV